MSVRLACSAVAALAALFLQTPTVDAQGRVLATPFGGSSPAVQTEPRITYGGVLPSPIGRPDDPSIVTAPDAETPNAEFAAERSQPTADWVDAAATAVEAMPHTCERLMEAVRGIDDSVREKPDWARQSDDLASLIKQLQDQDFAATGEDAEWSGVVTDISLEARSMNQSMAGRLREGLATDVFPAVRDAHQILQSDLLMPLEPFERAAGISPIPMNAAETSSYVDSFAAPVPNAAIPVPGVAIAVPGVAIPVPPPLNRPSFEFRLDIAPGLSSYGYQPFGLERYAYPGDAYRSYRHSYDRDRYDRYRYDSYRYDYRDRLDGFGAAPFGPAPFGPPVGIQVYPAPAFRYGFGVPVHPYGFGPAFGW